LTEENFSGRRGDSNLRGWKGWKGWKGSWMDLLMLLEWMDDEEEIGMAHSRESGDDVWGRALTSFCWV
jgi:hypothetical protein